MATKNPYRVQPAKTLDYDALMSNLNALPGQSDPEEKPSVARRIGDTAVQFGQGAVTGVKMMSDIFGANNAVSSGLSDVNQALDGLLSATAQGDKQKVAQIMQEAEGKGWGEQIVAGLKAAGVDPVGLAANALGTSLPTMATMLIPGAGPAAVAARMGAGVAMGAGQGVGAVKGQIYDETKRKWLEARATPEQAEAKAQEAAAYGGENTDQMAIGGVLGMGSVLGAERALGKVLHGASKAGPGMLGRVATSTLAETGTEMLQGGQEKFATNTALNRQGFDVDPMSGVIANATLEGAAAAHIGAVAGIPKPAVATAPGIDPAQEAADTIRATEKVPESGALTKAVNAGVEAKAQAVEAGGLQLAPLVVEQTATATNGLALEPLPGESAPEPVDDPVRDQILALPDGARQDALRAYAVVNRTDVAKGVQQYNRKLLDRLLAENKPEPEPAPEIGGVIRTFDPASPPVSPLSLAPMGGNVYDNGIDFQSDSQAELASRSAELDRLTQRAPRTRTDGVDLDLQADPVLNYLDNLRGVNTPAARAYVRDFDAGRITPADVQRRMVAEQGVTPDQRIARAAAEAPATADPVADRLRQAVSQRATPAPTDILNPAGEPFKTRMAADRAAKKTPGAVVPVEGGFVVRPQEPVNVQDVPQAPEVPQAAPVVSQPSQAQEAVGTQPAGPTAGVPAEGAGAVEAAGVEVGGFDSVAFDNSRADTIKASKAAGNKHLDELPAYVESMRGQQVYYAHDNKVRGVIRTVDNRGNVYIDWADSYSAEKEMASPVKDGKKTVMRSSIGPTDLKDYVVGEPNKPQAKTQQAQAATENVASNSAGQDKKARQPKSVAQAGDADAIAALIQQSIAENRIKANEKIAREKVAKGYLTQEQADADLQRIREGFANTKPNQWAQALAKAIAEKDPRPLVGAWAKEGQGTYGVEGSMAGFEKATGVKLRRLNSADRAKAIFDWAGWTEDQVAADVAERRKLKAESDAASEAKSQAEYDDRITERAAKELVLIKDTQQKLPIKEYVDGLISQGYNTILSSKRGAITKTYLANQRGDGYPLPVGVMRDYAQAAVRRAAAANSGVEAQAKETTHNGTRIYPTKIKVGDEVKSMWAVESPDNQRRRAAGERAISGDSLHDTLEQAQAAAEREAKRDAEQQVAKAEQDAADKARLEAEEARKAVNRPKTVVERRKDAILDGPSKIGQGTKRAVITTAVDNGYVIEAKMVYDYAAKKRDQEAVDRASRAGYILGLSNENLPLVKAGNEAKARLKEGKYEKPEYRVYQGSDTKAPFREITKTEYDYAQELKAQREAAPQAEAAPAAATQQATDDFLPEGWTKSVNGYTKRPVYRMEQGGGQPFAVVTQVEGMQYEVQIRHGDKQLTVSNQTGALSEVLAKAETELTRMTQADSVTHQDPGEKAEAATPGVVTDSLKKAARNEDTKPSEMRKWLVAEIDKELLQAADRPDYDEAVKRMGEKDAISMFTGNGPLGKNNETGYITFDVPGDGKYKVRNSVRGLLEFRKNVVASQGFKDSGQKRAKPEQNDGVQGGSGGNMAAITNMIEEGDFEAARDYAEAVGIARLFVSKTPKNRDVLYAEQDGKLREVTYLTAEQKAQWDRFMSDGTLPTPPDTRPQPAPKTAAQLDEEKRQAAEAEEKRPKDTGWNLAGNGYAGKRYIGRNITLDDGRQVVARVYENAGAYEEAEVKVDGVRKFAVTDRENAQDKADAFVKTLTATSEKITDKLASPDKMTPRQFDDWIRQRATVQTEQFRGDRNHGGGDEGVGYIHLSGKVEPGGTSWAGTARGAKDARDTRLIFRTDDNKIVWYDDASQQAYEVPKDDTRLEITRPELTPKQARDPQEITVTVDGADYTVTFDEPLATISNQAFQDNLDEYGTPGVAKAEFRKLRAQAQAGGASESAATGARRDPTKVSMFNPYEDGDIVTIDGQDWTVKQDTPGWYLTNTGNWRGNHPTIRNIKAMADLIREVEQASVARKAAAPQPEAPKLTPAEAKSLMEWQDLGQKDGVKTHALTFYESQADKDAKRGRMIVAKVSKEVDSGNWTVEGTGEKLAVLGMAKKKAEQVGMEKAVADGFVEQGAPAPANDRNAFTLQRLNRETGQMEPVTFERGEYVRYTVGGKDQFGEIDGISQARKEFSVDGLWYPFGFAYKAERPAAPKADTVPLSSVIDKVNAKNGQGLTDADRVPEQKPASKTPTVDHHNATMAAVREGKATPEQFQSSFEQVVSNKDAIVAELDTMTKVQLLREGGPLVQMRYANEKKADVVDAVYRQIVGEYALGESVTYSMGKGAYEAAVRKMVEATDADKLARYVTDRKAAAEEMQARRAAKAAAIENPQTLGDFREVLNAKIREGMTRKEAFLTLTPQQRIQYDTLEAESTREARENRKRAQKTEVRAAGQTTAGEIVATKHTRDGYDLFVVKLADRLSKEDYSTVLASAKKLGGWYSAFRGNGAIPGFQFKDKANAEAFLALAGGDTTAAQEQVAQRRDAFEDDRSQTAVERLRAMADKLEEGAAEVEGQQRKTNTERRARFASAAMASAAADKAKAQTMRNIARAIEDGEAKFLDAVRTKSQVDMLTGIVDTAKGAELRAKYPSYADQEKRKGEPPTAETADFADFPSYSAFRSDLATLGRQMLEVDGTKKLGQRLMSVADDVTDAYLEFAKANIQQVSQFGRGDALAEFASKDEAERAIKRSGLTGKAIVLPIKRGQNRVILSPSEAIGRGLWQGDGDKRITLTAEFGAELVEAIGRRGNKQNQLPVPWQFQNAYDRRKALSRIGIETPSEFRAALREFIGLKEQAVANRTRAMELQMVGRKADGLDFFPTSAEVANQMIEAADLTPDMAVLEPSAGMGHLADRIRQAGAEPDVIEISADRRELLEEKGYTTQAVDDFLDLKPREFYTFGDTFRAPDGAEGIMRGANGNRVRLVNQAGDMVGAGYYDRADLTGIAHNGTASGYDRIIMNPPFSNRRDAEHVRHAYSLLKPGGRIVAIMGEGVFFGQDKKAQDFREWLESVGGTSEKLPEGSFMDPSLPVNTSVNARMVVIDKPATEGGNVAMFSRAQPAIRSAPPADSNARNVATQQLVDGLKAKWTRAPEIIVARNMQDAQIPQEVRDYDALLKSQGATGEPRGFIYKGKVYLLSDQLKGPQQIAEVLFHEVLGHYGLRGAFGDGLTPILKQLGTLRRKEVVAKAREYGLFNKDALGGLDKAAASDSQIWAAMSDKQRLDAAEEVLAEMAQTKPELGYVKRAIAAIRNWLRANVPGFKNLKLTDADIVQAYILPARAYVTRSNETVQQAIDRAMADAGFSRTAGDQTQTESFQRWFKDSKAVDAEGKPLVVYHGTNADISAFDVSKLGTASGADSAKMGFFFASNPAVASSYADTFNEYRDTKLGRVLSKLTGGLFEPFSEALLRTVGRSAIVSGGNVMPVYLAIKNPKIVDFRGSSYREKTYAQIISEAKSEGHDGLILRNTFDEGYVDGGDQITDVYVAFEPTQIKSAIGNNGDFNPANPDIRFSRTTDAAKAVGDTLKSITVSNVKQRAGFKLTDYLGIGLQALGRRQIVDIYGDMIPLGEYNRLVQQMEADKNEGSAEADQLVTRWAKLEDEGKLADLMHDATLAQIDPAEDFVEGDDKGKYLELQRKYNLLSDEAKKVYADTRDSYKAHHAKVRSAIKERIERSEIKGERKAALLKQMDDEFFKAVKGVYFPLARFGQYAVTVKGPDGKVESVSRAETKAEAEALRNNLLSAFPRDKGFTVGRVMLSKDFIADRDAVGRGFMTELYQVLDKQDMDAAQRAELEDTLGQLYLSSLPDLSWAKHGIHRKGTPGFSQDARRAFAQNMFHGARYLAKLRYSDLMQDELAAMQRHVDDWREVEDFDQNSAQRVVDEMNKRHESLMNPKSNPLSTALTSLGFVFHLGLSPASAMVNLSQTALVAYPIMGAKWGFGKASAALLKASAEAAKGKNDITASLNADELAAYNKAVRAGTIDVTMAHDLAGIAQGEDAGVMWKIRPVMRYASFLFHHAERFNRQVTFVAAYRLAREAGADHKAAFEQATKATYDGHFDYGAANRPRIMQGNVAKVLLLFKQYGQNMVYTLARNAQQAMKGESPEVRAQARKALGGLLATHAAAAGVLGLPMVTTLLAAASMIGGDDDEPWDAKVALQNMLADTLGQKPAEVLAHGLSRLTPWDISGRVGLDKLIFPDVQEGLEGRRLGEAAMAAALGPVAGIGINVLKGLQDMSQGQYARGLEAMMPAALRGPIKAIRYESEGVQDKTGVVIKDEVSLAGVAGQFLGFSPSEVRNATEGKSAVIQQDRALGERRQELLTKAARATMAKDAEARAEAMKEIERFNQKNPTRRITPLNVLQSVRNRQKRIDQAEGGVYLPKNRRDAMEAGRFAVSE